VRAAKVLAFGRNATTGWVIAFLGFAHLNLSFHALGGYRNAYSDLDAISSSCVQTKTSSLAKPLLSRKKWLEAKGQLAQTLQTQERQDYDQLGDLLGGSAKDALQSRAAQQMQLIGACREILQGGL
jgi:hypothetical protein